MRSHLFFYLLTLFITKSSLAQKAYPPLPKANWQVCEVPNNIGYAFSYNATGSFEKAILYISDSEAIAAISNKKKFALIKINKNGQVLWEVPVEGCIAGISKFHGNAIVITVPDLKNSDELVWKKLKQIVATLYDAKTGRVIKQEIVYSKSPAFCEVKLIAKPSGQFHSIMVRNSQFDGKFSKVADELRGKTANLSIIQLSQDLYSAKQTDVKTDKEAIFLGIIANEKDELFIGSMTDTKIRIEKFNSSLVSQQKLEGSFYYNKSYFPEPTFFLNESNELSVLVGAHFKNDEKEYASQVWHFEFDKSKVSTTSPELLTKDFAKSIVPINDDKKKGIDHRHITSLRPIAITGLKDKIVVIKEIRFDHFPGKSIRYRNDAIVISFHDNNGKLLKNLCIDKSYETFIPIGRSLGYRLVDNKLTLLTSDNGKMLSYDNLLCVVNCDDLSIEQLSVIDKKNIGAPYSIEGAATFWFGNTILLNQVVPKETVLQKVEL